MALLFLVIQAVMDASDFDTGVLDTVSDFIILVAYFSTHIVFTFRFLFRGLDFNRF